MNVSSAISLPAERLSPMRVCWKHLRLPFQLTLAPIFLWGVYLAGKPLDARVLLGFFSFHFCLYTGITAFNTAYDRDAGPVGGMLCPPPAPPALLPLSLVLLLAGAGFAWCAGAAPLCVYAAIALMGLAYSHPRTRWKARPAGSAATVFLGQGVLGFLGGWTAARGAGGLLSMPAILGALSAAFTTLGIYPATQVYQTEEDAARGDRTLAVALGPASALRVGAASLAVAGLCAVLLMAARGRWLDGALLAAAYGALVWRLAQFATEYRAGGHTVASGYRAAMRLNSLASAAFALFILAHLAAPLVVRNARPERARETAYPVSK